jgi:hypothetical protein
MGAGMGISDFDLFSEASSLGDHESAMRSRGRRKVVSGCF